MQRSKPYLAVISGFLVLAGLFILDAHLWHSLTMQSSKSFSASPTLEWSIAFHFLLGALLSYKQWWHIIRDKGKPKLSWKILGIICVLMLGVIVIAANSGGWPIIPYRFNTSTFKMLAPIVPFVLAVYLFIPVGFLLPYVFRRVPKAVDAIPAAEEGGLSAANGISRDATAAMPVPSLENAKRLSLKPYITVVIFGATMAALCVIEFLVMTAFGPDEASQAMLRFLLEHKTYLTPLGMLCGHMLLGALLACYQWRSIFRHKGVLALSGPYVLLCVLLCLLLGYALYMYKSGWIQLYYMQRWYVYIMLGFFVPSMFRRV